MHGGGGRRRIQHAASPRSGQTISATRSTLTVGAGGKKLEDPACPPRPLEGRDAIFGPWMGWPPAPWYGQPSATGGRPIAAGLRPEGLRARHRLQFDHLQLSPINEPIVDCGADRQASLMAVPARCPPGSEGSESHGAAGEDDGGFNAALPLNQEIGGRTPFPGRLENRWATRPHDYSPTGRTSNPSFCSRVSTRTGSERDDETQLPLGGHFPPGCAARKDGRGDLVRGRVDHDGLFELLLGGLASLELGLAVVGGHRPIELPPMTASGFPRIDYAQYRRRVGMHVIRATSRSRYPEPHRRYSGEW